MTSTWCCITSPTSSPPCSQVGVYDGGLLDIYVFVVVVLFSTVLYFLVCVLRERRRSKCGVIFCLCLQPLVFLIKHTERGMGNMCCLNGHHCVSCSVVLLSLSVHLFTYVCFFFLLCQSPSLCQSVSLRLSVNIHLSLSVSVSLSVSLCFSICQSPSLCQYPSLCQSLSLCVSVSVSVSLSVSLCLYLKQFLLS